MDYSSDNLAQFLKSKGIELYGKKYSGDFVGISSFDIIFPKFIKHLAESGLASDYELMEGGPNVTVCETSNNKHGFVIDGKLVTIIPAYADLGHDEDEIRYLIQGLEISGPEETAKKIIEKLEAYATSLASTENLAELSEKHLEREDVRP